MTTGVSSTLPQVGEDVEPQIAPQRPEIPPARFACVYLSKSIRDAQRASALLEPSRIRVFHAADLNQAVNRLRRTRSHVLLTDTVFNGGDWKCAAEAARRFRRAPALVVASRMAGDRLWLAALERGAYGVVRKPFRQAELSRTLINAHAQAQSGGDLYMTA